MKSTSTPPAHTTTRHKDQAERQAFFERAYLALLSSAMSQFEAYDSDGNTVRLYSHPELDRQEELLSEKEHANLIRNRDNQALEQQFEEALHQDRSG